MAGDQRFIHALTPVDCSPRWYPAVMKFLVPSFFLVLLVSASSLAQTQDVEPVTVRVPVAQDAVVYGEDLTLGGNRANGTGQTLSVGNVQAGLNRRSLLFFNLDGAVPPGSVILDANLSLNVVSTTSAPFVALFRLFAPWAAGVTGPEDELLGGEAQTGDVTWNSLFFHETDMSRRLAWQQAGGDFQPDQPLLADAGEGSGTTVTYTSQGFVADVQSLLNQPDQHFGWILAGDESSFLTNLTQFASGENEDEDLRPLLEITYTEPSDIDKVVINYDALVTVAGRGEEGGRDNHWRQRYEGGNALEAELSRPSTAVAAEDGTIYFTDTYGHAIRKVTTDGRIETVAGTGVEGYNMDAGPALEIQLDQPNGLAVMPNGNLYILDIDNKRVRKVTSDGQLTTVFHDQTDPPFLTGRGLWVSPDEATIVYGSRTALKRWTAADDAITVLADGFERLTNIGLDPTTGDFLGADVDDDAVWRVDVENGSRELIAGGGSRSVSGVDAKEARLDGVRGLAVSSHGGYFLTAENGGNVWYVDINGTAHVLLQGSGNGNARGGENEVLPDLIGRNENLVSQPFAITIAPNGDLVLVTNETGFIRVIRKGRVPVITDAGLDDAGGFSMAWTAQIQRLYLVESSEDLETWDVLREVFSNRNVASFTESDLSRNAKLFYRVRFYYP